LVVACCLKVMTFGCCLWRWRNLWRLTCWWHLRHVDDICDTLMTTRWWHAWPVDEICDAWPVYGICDAWLVDDICDTLMTSVTHYTLMTYVTSQSLFVRMSFPVDMWRDGVFQHARCFLVVHKLTRQSFWREGYPTSLESMLTRRDLVRLETMLMKRDFVRLETMLTRGDPRQSYV